MQSHFDNYSIPLRLSLLIAIASITVFAQATGNTNVHGQWVGNSQVDGARLTEKTTLNLGALDTDDASLRIEGSRPCVLKQGRYSISNGDALSLTFKTANGGQACELLAQGVFTVRAGSSPRTLQFEVSYHNAKGGPTLRRGMLTRYP